MAVYPDIASLLRKQDKDRLVDLHRSLLSMMGHMALFVISLAAVFAINLSFLEYSRQLRWLAIIPLTVLLDIFRKYYNDLYIVGRDNLTHYEGRLSFSYNVPSIRYTDLRAVNVVQSVFGRMFDYGDIQLGTAGKDNYELSLDGMRSPQDLARLINDLRNESTKTSIAGISQSDATAILSTD
jgi:hypothetical protein